MANKKVFFKIVVPNYNNFIYIKKCLDSIKNQTFKDYVCIVVDDLSTDRSFEIAQIYERRDPEHFVAIKLDKKGYAGAARNKGIDYPVDSEYTWFIDSDDWIYDNSVLGRLHNNIINHKFPDVVRCSFIENGTLLKLTHNIIRHIETSDIKTIMKEGASPSKNCFKSKYKCKFIENRAKSNDIIWFLRLYDSVNINLISSEKYPCFVYNRLSVTSCQNNIDRILDIECTKAERLLLEDYKNEEFKTQHCKQFVVDSTNSRKNWYMDRITIQQFFSNSFMITIDNDKFEKTNKIFKKQFSGMAPIKVIGSHDKKLTGPQNCTKSHLNIIEYAKKNNLPFVAVFEDDAYPRINAEKYLNEYLYRIPKQAGMVILGWSNHTKNQDQKFNQPFNLVKTNICGSHSYILFNGMYDTYIKYMKTHPNATADCAIYNQIKNALIIHEPLFIQYSESKSMNNHSGYIYYGDHKNPPKGFDFIDKML